MIRRAPGSPSRYSAVRPEGDAIERLLDTFLERRADISTEDQAPSVQRFREMIGRDEKMLVVFEWIRTAAKSDISVLILGPTGSGKEVVARMIHELSRRGTENFQAVNCAALPDTLFESEIFGYEKGAFTGAHDRKPGRVELANRGTLFLDEIGDLSLVAQAKLLARARGSSIRAPGRTEVGARGLPPDFRDQPAARPVRPRQPLPRGPVLPRERVLDPAALAARAADRHSACSPIDSSPATARPTGCRSTRRRSRLKRWRRLQHLSVARQHPRAGKHRLASGALGARTGHSRHRHRVPASGSRSRRRSAAASADARRSRTRAHHPRARRRGVE